LGHGNWRSFDGEGSDRSGRAGFGREDLGEEALGSNDGEDESLGREDGGDADVHSGLSETDTWTRRGEPAGPFRGTGPRDWHRLDDRISYQLNLAFTDDPLIDAGKVQVLVSDGEVTLSGSVLSSTIKSRAEDIAASIVGVHNVHNRLHLDAHPAADTYVSDDESTHSSHSERRKPRGLPRTQW
jgi:hypothetical protein